jgi:hypothetical protein
MDRGFILNENEYICYRRNYFQISAALSLENTRNLAVYINGEHTSVQKFSISIHARVKGGSKEIELVQHTPKRDKGPQLRPQSKLVLPTGEIFNYSTVNNHVVTFERIQFKSATANNGKRRAAQQFFYLVLTLSAITPQGTVKLGECESAPLIVRGRSPSHYVDHRESDGTNENYNLTDCSYSINRVNTPIQNTGLAFNQPSFQFSPSTYIAQKTGSEMQNHIGYQSSNIQHTFNWLRARDDSGDPFFTNDSLQTLNTHSNSYSPMRIRSNYMPSPQDGRIDLREHLTLVTGRVESDKYPLSRLPTPLGYQGKMPIPADSNPAYNLPSLRSFPPIHQAYLHNNDSRISFENAIGHLAISGADNNSLDYEKSITNKFIPPSFQGLHSLDGYQ